MSEPVYDRTQILRNPRQHLVGLCGPVCRGFGRGRRDLCIPTANIDFNTVVHLTEAEISCDPSISSLARPRTPLADGVYAAWATVAGVGGPFPAMVSIGSNPTYGNEFRTIETYIAADFDCDFYDHQLQLLIVAQIRPMVKCGSFAILKSVIEDDIVYCKEILETDAALKLAREARFLH